jgi:hypothetical protein
MSLGLLGSLLVVTILAVPSLPAEAIAVTVGPVQGLLANHHGQDTVALHSTTT